MSDIPTVTYYAYSGTRYIGQYSGEDSAVLAFIAGKGWTMGPKPLASDRDLWVSIVSDATAAAASAGASAATAAAAVEGLDGYQETLAEGAFVDGDKSKLDSIEASATADQTGAEIKAAYEAEADTNAFTDAEKTAVGNLSTVATSGDYDDLSNRPAIFSGAYADLTGKPSLGTAAALDAGTTASKVVQLDGSAKLPAVDGSQLTGLATETTSTGTSGASQTVAFNAADIHVATADASVVTLTFSSANAVDQITLLIKNDLDGYTLEDAVDMGQGAWPFSPSGIESIVVNPDGTRAFIMAFANDRIYQVDFATPFDHTTMTYSGVSMSMSDANPYGLAVSTDGLHLYYCGLSLDRVHQHTMSTAWDLSTVGSEVGFVSVSAQANNPYGLDISPDGTRLIVTFETAIYQYTLSTAFTVSTATYDSVSLNPTETGSTRNARFKPDGTKVFISDTTNTVFQYSLGTAWSLASPTYDSLSLDLPDSSFFIEGGGGYLFAPDNGGINRFLLDPLSLVYPSTLQKPALATPHIGQSIALQIITTDTGASYQVVSAEEPIS